VSARLVPNSEGFALQGELDFASVPELFEQARRVLESTPSLITIDLKDIVRTNSAGLALLVGIARQANLAGSSLRLTSVSAQLLALARANKLEGMLGLACD
jgi:phospholipid transport system transporter-binding protein